MDELRTSLRRLRERIPPGRAELNRRFEEQEVNLRRLRRRLERLEASLSSGEAEERIFRMRLPVLDGSDACILDIALPARLYVPELLERDGLAGYEAPTIATWLTLLSSAGPGAAFDIGANVGPFAWLAAALSDRQVVAFEPVPELLAAVESVASRNGLSIATERHAISDHDGTATLYLSDQTDSSNSLVAGFRRSSSSIEVPVTTLDTYTERSGIVPAVMKIDTETNEPDVIRGGHTVLTEHRPWMIVEVLAGRTEERLMEALEPLGYTWYPIDERLPFTATDRIVGDPTYANTNWLLAPQSPDASFWERVAAWSAALRACTPIL